MKAAKKANEDPGKKLIPTGKTRLFKRTKQKIHWKTDKADEAKAEPVVEKAKEVPVPSRSQTRRTYRDTIKAEQDKIKEIKRRDLEPWRTEELIKPIQERIDRLSSDLDKFNQTAIENRRAYEASKSTPTFKAGGKFKAVKKK